MFSLQTLNGTASAKFAIQKIDNEQNYNAETIVYLWTASFQSHNPLSQLLLTLGKWFFRGGIFMRLYEFLTNFSS